MTAIATFLAAVWLGVLTVTVYIVYREMKRK